MNWNELWNTMDWTVFWTAFGAIGTTVGSLTTAIAVVVAVKQYKQPLEKLIKVEFTSAISCDENGRPLEFYCITVKNRGIRPVQINSLYIRGTKKNLWINNAQFISNAKVDLPVKIEPEESKDFLFEVDNFSRAIRKAVNDNILKRNKRLTVLVTDSIGDKHCCKTPVRIKNLVKSI